MRVMTDTTCAIPWNICGERGYGAKEVMQLTGVTYRQLDYWSRRGFLGLVTGGGGSGRRRQWTHDQVVNVAKLIGASRSRAGWARRS